MTGGESSKKGSKRGKKQRVATIAAAFIEASQGHNVGIRITDEQPNANEVSPTAEPNQPRAENESNSESLKKTRGKTKMLNMNKGEEKETRLLVKFNPNGQPIRKNASRFASFLGNIARELLPINVASWEKFQRLIKVNYGSLSWYLMYELHT